MADKNAIRANAKEETEAKGPKPGSGAAPDDNDLRRELKSEQVRDMRQTRRIRLERHRQMWLIRSRVYKFLMFPFAVVSLLMTTGLGLAVYAPGVWKLFCGESPVLLYLKQNGDGTPLAALILGTFISFAVVFSALAFGVFVSARDGQGGGSAAQNIMNMMQDTNNGG